MLEKPILEKPVIAGDRSTWGYKLNENIDNQDVFNESLIKNIDGIEQELLRLDDVKLEEADLDPLIKDRVDNYIETDAKPTFEEWVDTEVKPDINNYIVIKKDEIDNHVETVSKPELDDYTELKKLELEGLANESITEITTIVDNSKTEIGDLTEASITEINTVVDNSKTEIGDLTAEKVLEIETVTNDKIEILTSHTDSEIIRLQDAVKIVKFKGILPQGESIIPIPVGEDITLEKGAVLNIEGYVYIEDVNFTVDTENNQLIVNEIFEQDMNYEVIVSLSPFTLAEHDDTKVDKVSVVQEIGQSTELIMSQKAVSDAIKNSSCIPSVTDIIAVSSSRDEDNSCPETSNYFETTEDTSNIEYYLKQFNSPRIIAMKGANGKHLNPFKELGIYPYSEIGRCLCDINTGDIIHWLHEEDSNKLKDGRTLIEAGIDVMDYDTMVYIPKFYYKREWINNEIKDFISTSREMFGGDIRDWKIMDCFKREDGTIRDYILVGTYKGFVSNNQLRSLSGNKPTVSQTISWFRDKARQGRSNKFNIETIDIIACIQMLYKVAFKNLNSQLMVGEGYTGSSNNSSIASGGTKSLGNRSGFLGVNGKSSISLFGIEDFYGNVWSFVDGLITKDDGYYKQYIPSKFGTAGYDYSYKTTPLTSETGTWEWVKSMTNFSSDEFLYLNIPTKTLDTDSGDKFYCDKFSYHRKSQENICLFGAPWTYSAYAGAFCLSLIKFVAYLAAHVGARLVFLP